MIDRQPVHLFSKAARVLRIKFCRQLAVIGLPVQQPEIGQETLLAEYQVHGPGGDKRIVPGRLQGK